MEIKEVRGGEKLRYMQLLLLADESERMIIRYLGRGRMFVLTDGGRALAECVVTDEGGGVLELKNLAVAGEFQRMGHGRALVEFIIREFSGEFETLTVGTGESPLTLPFYEKCGFEYSHRIKNFFTDNYDKPIYEGGVLLADMVCLRRALKPEQQK